VYLLQHRGTHAAHEAVCCGRLRAATVCLPRTSLESRNIRSKGIEQAPTRFILALLKSKKSRAVVRASSLDQKIVVAGSSYKFRCCMVEFQGPNSLKRNREHSQRPETSPYTL
jgi:hypothetical protein